MARTVTKGYCYLCGKYLAKSGILRHVAASHTPSGADVQRCVVLKVEAGDYWLYLDVADTSSLKTVDQFLRKIWLECCGHMSSFYYLQKSSGWYGGGIQEIGMTRKLHTFSEGESFLHDYDFGSTTTLKLTVMDTHAFRPRQKNAVRLLARNEDYVFACRNCGKPADYINAGCLYGPESPFVCGDCAAKRRQKMEAEEADDESISDDDLEFDLDCLLPVVNSPRMGVCAYAGEQDVYTFDDWKATHPAAK